MDNIAPIESLLLNPITDATRRERRALLGVSFAGIVVTYTDLVPRKITALGIEFSQVDMSNLLFALSLVVAYFLITFLLYGASDFSAWRASVHKAAVEKAWRYAEDDEEMSDYEEKLNKASPDIQKSILATTKGSSIFWRRYLRPIAYFRAIWEFALPVVIGGWSIFSLIVYKP